MKLSIIIVNWNVKPLLQNCLESIFCYLKDFEAEIIVVDNGSQDGSREYLRNIEKKRNNIKIILNNENFGFARANNQALEQARGKIILFLNPDTEIREESLQKAIKFMENNHDCGALGCQLIGLDGKTQPSVRNFPTILSQAMIFLKLQYLFPKIIWLKEYFQINFNYEKIGEVNQIAGTFIMTKREVIDQVGGFDESFHLWFEDVDFCYRVKKAGWKVIYIPESKILHYGGQSFWQLMSWQRQKIYNHSALIYFKKHSSIKFYWPLILLSFVSLFLAFLSEFFSPATKINLKNRLKVN